MFRFSIFEIVFDLLFGWLFGHDQSNGFHIFNFNAYICFFLTIIVVGVGFVLVSSISNPQPARSFIPGYARTSAMAASTVTTQHHTITSTSHRHHNGSSYTATAKKHTAPAKAHTGQGNTHAGSAHHAKQVKLSN
ncbi:hypothetical protein BH11CYA1_BH11CYA1_39910 [soil metagenome]